MKKKCTKNILKIIYLCTCILLTACDRGNQEKQCQTQISEPIETKERKDVTEEESFESININETSEQETSFEIETEDKTIVSETTTLKEEETSINVDDNSGEDSNISDNKQNSSDREPDDNKKPDDEESDDTDKESDNRDIDISGEEKMTTEPPQNELDREIANLPENPDYGYSITSYADKSGNQGMFYTIRNNYTSALIVIDGGWGSNEEYVRKVIKSKGNVVDAWIITHFHNDHVDAVSAILEEPRGITIKQIYDSPFDYEKYAGVAQSWDRLDSFERYLNISKNYNNITHLKEGDEFEIAGLEFFVLNAYSDKLDKYGDFCNNGSLMFKVSSGKSSMIFCGDCHSDKLGYELIDKYGEKMKSDYVQLGHHGNASFSPDIYEYMAPKGVVFDAPEWLMNSYIFTAKELKEYFEGKGVRCYDYTMGVNQIVID